MIKLLVIAGLSFFNPRPDSIGIETINGKTFILHRVDERETLFSISRRYGVSVNQLLEVNPTADAGLAIGQVLRVPYMPKPKAAPGDIRHRVAEGETLYSIARHYNVSVDEIKRWNNLQDNALRIGQELIIRSSSAVTAAQPQSITAPQPNSIQTVHTVAAGETLSSISRQYNVSVQQLKIWNSLSSESLKVGQRLFVSQPMYSTSTPPPAVSETKTLPTQQPTTAVGSEPESKSNQKVHTVAAGETLFSISRQYNVSVQQLKGWNNLPTESLKIGQQLFVSQSMSGTTLVKEPVVETKIPPVQEQDIIPQPEPQVITISESVKDKDEIRENGIAEVIEGTDGNRKYLALHRTAPAGTILKVRNEMNNREVFVRVVGVLPNTGLTEKVLIRISKSAYERLGAIDTRFRVEVTYYK